MSNGVVAAQLPAPPARWRPSPQGAMARMIVLGVIAAVFLTVPLYISAGKITVVMQAAIFAIVGLSMNIIMGYAGQVSLGHAAFYGIGGFVSATVVSSPSLGLPFPFAIAAAGLSGAGTALILGFAALRLRGLYLALVTIAYGAVAQSTLFRLGIFNNGAGVSAPRPSLFEGDIAYAYLCIMVLGVAVVFDWRLTSSKAGRAIQGLRDDERVAASWGINVTQYKLLAFIISGAMAGIAGGLFAHVFQGVSEGGYGQTLSLTFVFMTVVGGLGSRWGVIIASVFFASISSLIGLVESAHIGFLSWLDPQWEPLIGATLMVVTLILYPGGLAEQMKPALRWLGFGPFHAEEGGEAVASPAGGGSNVRP